MSGIYLRRKHYCRRPDDGRRGDILQCDCRRRWILKSDWLDPQEGALIWRRVLRPWPRPVRQPFEGRAAVPTREDR